YYSARLTPLPGPDSSRESNHRLAQITQYARQLASSPSIIDNRSRQHLNDVGLTAWDCVIINQIIGFIGFQARTIATFQAYLGHPVRWLPGLEIQN
ncbi:CMD domain-containing protein, partial [Salmonella enterica]|nr:CMD domain-containing protein [Salmonella enterica]